MIRGLAGQLDPVPLLQERVKKHVHNMSIQGDAVLQFLPSFHGCIVIGRIRWRVSGEGAQQAEGLFHEPGPYPGFLIEQLLSELEDRILAILPALVAAHILQVFGNVLDHVEAAAPCLETDQPVAPGIFPEAGPDRQDFPDGGGVFSVRRASVGVQKPTRCKACDISDRVFPHILQGDPEGGRLMGGQHMSDAVAGSPSGKSAVPAAAFGREQFGSAKILLNSPGSAFAVLHEFDLPGVLGIGAA